ncbi:hypothetical protein ACQPYE_05780 [Actinosynnema sp. CA-299493]
MRRLILGAVVLAAGAVVGAVGGTAAATVEMSGATTTWTAMDDPGFTCERIEDQGDRIAAYGCEPVPEGEFAGPFTVEDGNEKFVCGYGVAYADDGLLGDECRAID